MNAAAEVSQSTALVNTSFSKQIPYLQLAWDSTSLGYLKTCPKKYYWAIVRGLTTPFKSVDLEFGILIHGARERYYHAITNGAAHDDAIDVALDWTLNATWDDRLKRPWISEDPNKNHYNLVRSVIWYLDRWQDDPLKTVVLANGKPAVELSFRFPSGIFANNGEEYIICGHLDRLAKHHNNTHPTDLKSTKHTLNDDYFLQFSPDNQMSLYSFAGKVVYQTTTGNIIIDAVQVAVSFSEFSRGVVSRTDDQHDEWYKDLQFYLQQAEGYAIVQHWPMNDKACFRCEFRELCRKPPSVREQWITGRYTTRIWDPLVVRGDI